MSAPTGQTSRGGRRYAEVAATLAFVLAAVAVVLAVRANDKAGQSNSKAPTPRERAIVGAQLAPDTLGGREIDESKLGPVPRSQTARSADNARRLGGRPPSAFAPAARFTTTRGLVKLSEGDHRVVLRRSPFTFEASCARRGNASVLTLTARSTAGGTLMTISGRPQPEFGGKTSRDFATLNGIRRLWLTNQPYTITAPSGASLAGMVSFGTRIFGRDCVVAAYAIG